MGLDQELLHTETMHVINLALRSVCLCSTENAVELPINCIAAVMSPKSGPDFDNIIFRLSTRDDTISPMSSGGVPAAIDVSMYVTDALIAASMA